MITAVILTKNEEKNIKGCLEALSWCDEILVIDDNSNDKTVSIAQKAGARVIVHSLNGDFSRQRNFGLEKAKGDWVMFVDADERVSSALWYEIMQHTSNSLENYSGFFIKRMDVIWGKELNHGETGNIKLLKLAKKTSGKWEGKVHEKWVITGNKMVLGNPLLHYPHTGVDKFLREINVYTDIRAKDLFEKKVKTNWILIILYPLGKFIQNFLFKRGFMDGIPGLLVAVMMSFHSFLVRSKLWLLWHKSMNR